MYRWRPACHPLQLLPRAYLLQRRPEFINAALNYSAHLFSTAQRDLVLKPARPGKR